MLFHTTYFSEFVLWSNIISENLFFFLDLFVHKLIFDKNSWFLLLSLNYSIMYAVGKETSKPETCYCLASMKTFLLLLTKSPNTRNFLPLSALCLFRFFIFIFWPIETTTTNLQGLTHSNPSESTNQVTLSNKHINHFFLA